MRIMCLLYTTSEYMLIIDYIYAICFSKLLSIMNIICNQFI